MESNLAEPAPEGQPILAQRFSAGKSGRDRPSPRGTTDISPTIQSWVDGRKSAEFPRAGPERARRVEWGLTRASSPMSFRARPSHSFTNDSIESRNLLCPWYPCLENRETWGTHFCGSSQDLGHPPNHPPQSRNLHWATVEVERSRF